MNNQSLIFFNILKNASMVRKERIIIKHTKFLVKILTLLYYEGLIQSFTVNTAKKSITISLRYSHGKDLFKNLKTFVQPTKVSNLSYRDICKLSTKRFISVFSTDKGLITGINSKRYRLGGKLYFIC